jgi:hypothetical protein
MDQHRRLSLKAASLTGRDLLPPVSAPLIDMNIAKTTNMTSSSQSSQPSALDPAQQRVLNASDDTPS